MLRQRLLTALLLVPTVVLLVLFSPTLPVALAFGLVVLLGALEWARLSGLNHPLGRALYLVILALLLIAAEWWRRQHGALPLYAAAALWWLVVLGLLPRVRVVEDRSARGFSLATAAAGPLVLVPAWLALVELHGRQPGGPALLLFLLVMIWVADSAAYFAGRRWGRVRLAPAISPGKTREGVYGAVAGLLLAGVALWQWGIIEGLGLPGSLLVCLASGLFSIVGDLFESWIKRRRGVKDSGALLPGHGGVLDRIDSLTAAIPIFVLGLIGVGAL